MFGNYVIDKEISKVTNLTWDNKKGDYDKTPEELINFLREYEELCMKYDITLSHEDGHGGFLIEPYDESNIEWVCHASDTRANDVELKS